MGPWSLDPAEIGALRFAKAQKAFEQRDAVSAIVEAEELLEDDPDNLDALMLVADASLMIGDAGVARAAYLHVLDMQPGDFLALAGLGVASFELTDLEGCLDACERCLAGAPAMAEAWYYKGLALERLGRPDDAMEAFRRAARLDPRGFPVHQPFPDTIWDEAMQLAPGLLSERLRSWFDAVPILVEDFPSVEDLRTEQPPLSPAAGALYKGTPPPLGTLDPWAMRPDELRLYRRNLERSAPSPHDLPWVIATALRLEALDWLGLDDAQEPLQQL